MNGTTPVSWESIPPATDPTLQRIVIVGCSRRKKPSQKLLPALELYEGGCIPAVRARLGASPQRRSRIRILSARHGLVHPETLLLPYDEVLTPIRARDLRPSVTAALTSDFAGTGTPAEVLVIAEPLYLVLLTDLLALPIRVPWVSDYATGWPEASAILDSWSW